MGYSYEQMYKESEEFPIGLFSRNVYLEQAHHHIEYEIFYIDEGSVNVGIEDSVTAM